jgi:hypothetical protein
MMPRRHSPLRSGRSALALGLVGLSLAACQGVPQPESSSSSFSRVDLGYGGVIMPDACEVTDHTAMHLPPGCANAYNLQRMAVRQQDLVQGRRMGPAPAAPAARASNVYLYKTETIPGQVPAMRPTPPPVEETGTQ